MSQAVLVLSTGEHISTLSKGGLGIRNCLLITDETKLYCDTNIKLAIIKMYNPSELQ